MSEMVSAASARAAAERHRRDLAATDPGLAAWEPAAVGAPVRVHTLAGEPSYWLVPVEAEERLVGFVRVNAAGKPVAGGTLGGRPSSAPAVVTWITEEEAAARAREAAGPGARVGRPLYVHDGPPGREAWRVEVREPGGAPRLLLVTMGGVSEPTGGGDLE